MAAKLVAPAFSAAAMVAPDETVPGGLGPGKLVETGGNPRVFPKTGRFLTWDDPFKWILISFQIFGMFH